MPTNLSSFVIYSSELISPADLYNEAQATEDFLDENSTTAQNISHLIHQSDEQRRKDVVQKMAQTHYNPGSI